MRKREEGQRTLNVVVEGADAVAVALQQVEGRRVAEVLKLRQRTRTRRQARASTAHEHRQTRIPSCCRSPQTASERSERYTL